MIALIVVCIVTLISKSSCEPPPQPPQPIVHRLSPIHGGTDKASANSFTCPGKGGITEIRYYAGKFISQVEFICSSNDGIRSFGPFGTATGTAGKLSCPPEQYMCSFYGKSGKYVSQLGARCRNVTDDLKGNCADIGSINGSDPIVGNAFDDLAYSNGFRLDGVQVWSTQQVAAIQSDYVNDDVQLCTEDCNNYQEALGPLYGTVTGESIVFLCPNNGAITAMTTVAPLTYNYYGGFDGFVKSIQFVCTSGLGSTTMPTIGQKIDNTTEGVRFIKCRPGMIAGSFHGVYRSQTIVSLGIRCVKPGKTGTAPKFEAHGGISGTKFDDAQYSDKGWRPLQIRVTYTSTAITAFQGKYGNAEVSTNCFVTNIEITDETFQAVSDGFEVIGIATGTSCDTGNVTSQTIKVQYLRQVTESVSIATTDGGDMNWGASLSISATASFQAFGVKGSVSVGLTASTGGSKQWSTTNSAATSLSTGQSAAGVLTYKTPGAGAVIGYVDRYKLDRDNVDVRYHYECESGDASYTIGTINLKSTTYGCAYFENIQFEYPTNGCTNASRTCVKALNGNQITLNSDSFREQFMRCKGG